MFSLNALRRQMKGENNLQNPDLRDGEGKGLRVAGDRCPGAGFGRALRASLRTS